MQATDVIGWTASLCLFVTVGAQVVKQIKERTGKGVSSLLFIGQISASALFLIYSVLKSDAVFIVSNAFLVITAVVGQIALVRNRQREAAK